MNRRHISSLQHPTIKHLAKLRQNSDYRDDHHAVVVAGTKLVHELVQDGFSLITIIATDESVIPPQAEADEIFLVTDEIIRKITGLKTNDGILAEITKPKQNDLSGVKKLLVCDGINDPGNLGTLLRTALAFDWDGVYLINPICDPYNDKALRAAKGATFRLPICQGSWDDLLALANKNNLNLWAADLKGKAVDEVAKNVGMALVMSHEAHGLSEFAVKHCQRITIPMSGKIESLNVAIAGGIIMYELGKR